MKALPLSLLAALCAALLCTDVAAQRAAKSRSASHGAARPVVSLPIAAPVSRLRGHDHDHDHDHGRDRGRSRHDHDRSRSGRWETVCEQVLVPGYFSEEHLPPRYGWIYSSCGHRHWGLIERGGCRRVWIPARYETRHRRVWVRC